MEKVKKVFLVGVVSIVFAWEAFALGFDGYMIYLQTTGQHEKIHEITNWFDSNFRGDAI